jgi:hypothetical protein
MVEGTRHNILKHSHRSPRRVIALDVRPRKTGFAVFEGTRLLDWGVGNYRERGIHFRIAASRRIDGLLDLHLPSLVVLRERGANSAAAAKRRGTVIQMITSKAKRNSIRLRILSASTIKRFYEGQGCRTTHQIASILTEWYPELRWRLPAKRRKWDAEKYTMTLFDAAAAGVCFFGGVDITTTLKDLDSATSVAPPLANRPDPGPPAVGEGPPK